MWYKNLIGLFLLGQAYAGLYDELLWHPDHSACEGTFLPLSKDLQVLPENQTVITTDKKSELYLGKKASLRDVTLNQNGVKIFSEDADVAMVEDNKIENIDFLAQTSYQDNDFVVTAEKGYYNLSKDILALDELSYRIGSLKNIAWGKALKLNRNQDKVYRFKDVSVSFCPPSSPTWVLNTDKMVYYPQERLVTLDNPGLVLNGTELIKFPYFSFITSGRKSGFLQPELSYTREYGVMYKQPYYLNLAPNYDWVLAPILFTRGSYGFNQLFRYLTPSENGKFGSEVIWDERAAEIRYQANWLHHYSPWSGNQIEINMTRFSDSNWFRDFGNTLQILDILNPVEMITMDQNSKWGTVNFHATKYVSYASTLPSSEVIYFRPNRYILNGSWELASLLQVGHYYNLQDSNQGAFDASVHRVVGDISLEQNFIRSYGYWRNKIGEIIRYYNSDNVSEESSAIPIFATEAGIFLEKQGGHFYQTLTPKMYYVYVPYRPQYDYPIIDASVKSSSNLSSLFSARRFQGYDRVGDENALVLTLSSMHKQANATYELEMGKQINIESPRLCLKQDCADGSYAYNPLIINLKGSQDNVRMNANANYDTSLKSFRNIGADFEVKDFLRSDWIIRYAYSAGTSTDYLSRLGVKQTWYVNEFLTLDGAIVKDFKDDQFFSYEVGSHYDTCCWNSNITFGRRYIGENESDSSSSDNYQWYASVELFLKGFSSRPVVHVGKHDNQKEILSTV